ncbi:hypothetical protein PAPYR_3566 [Paratrimastix pyriformis]|uniref:FZ domain-containing protein n=1 Tax=Paratrimastix pyriformis TaxID=342808 RepID=A0ABQ8UP03_9EUKA|nr:hypothetical protein PAPYR_3566 [Paratrimastix pyriformis]
MMILFGLLLTSLASLTAAADICSGTCVTGTSLTDSPCAQFLGYSVCMWNRTTQATMVQSGMSMMDELIINDPTIAPGCRSSYQAYLCSVAYSRCDPSTLATYDACRSTCTAFLDTCGGEDLKTEAGSEDLCQIHADTTPCTSPVPVSVKPPTPVASSTTSNPLQGRSPVPAIPSPRASPLPPPPIKTPTTTVPTPIKTPSQPIPRPSPIVKPTPTPRAVLSPVPRTSPTVSPPQPRISPQPQPRISPQPRVSPVTPPPQPRTSPQPNPEITPKKGGAEGLDSTLRIGLLFAVVAALLA